MGPQELKTWLLLNGAMEDSSIAQKILHDLSHSSLQDPPKMFRAELRKKKKKIQKKAFLARVFIVLWDSIPASLVSDRLLSQDWPKLLHYSIQTENKQLLRELFLRIPHRDIRIINIFSRDNLINTYDLGENFRKLLIELIDNHLAISNPSIYRP